MAKPSKSSDPTRQERKAKKRALEDKVPDLPGDEGAVEDLDAEAGERKLKKRKRNDEGDDVDNGEITEKKFKKSKKEKKEKKSNTQDVEANAVEVAGELAEKDSKNGKKEKRGAKTKTTPHSNSVSESVSIPVLQSNSGSISLPTETPDVETQTGGEEPKKSKKERKAERRAKELAEAAAVSTNGASTVTEAKETIAENGDTPAATTPAKKNNRNREKKRLAAAAGTDGEKVKSKDAEKGKTTDKGGETGGKKSKDRFIVFVGNLPFTTTTASLTSHFAKFHPTSVRVLTDKENPTKCKGTAFVEFAGYDHMKTCLQVMHHSIFDDKLSASRKINVELTVGGGGNKTNRLNKIQEKNKRLGEQRIRKIQEEEKAKYAKAAKKAAGEGVDETGIHPSRRALVPGV